MIENIFKKIQTLDKAMEHIQDGVTLMVGGFGGVGAPPLLCKGILDKNVRDITLISNDASFPNVGVGPIVCNGQVKKMITTHIGSNPFAGKRMNDKLMEVTFIPQGTFCEQIRAGAMGLGGVLIDTGIDTIIAEGYEKYKLNNKDYMIAPAITAEVAIIYAKKADTYGNLVYDKTARCSNPIMAAACDYVIVQADEIVALGELDPEEIITSGIYVDMIISGKGGEWKWAWEKKN
ncbi:CoA transferase subunit A [[Clostridium] fimetarium]|uniref:Acetate CoA/acetoacetate CoA-transferase alpha subunit n=1 Tax=[Clostridium] fimetarium TaxID=99656 RepID=A0A1I0RSZ3_9FIRM|nr:CoA transferase subunit A [[Clostridium] fimetarium]SEW44496.1 acetate CoA/acetoacetate CoA-transferase alpha subunit [[Clostridium] fimetarium]